MYIIISNSVSMHYTKHLCTHCLINPHMASNLGILCFHLTDKETEIKPSGPNFPTYFPFFFLLNKSLKKFSMYYCPKRG